MEAILLNEEGHPFTSDSERLKKACKEIEERIKHDDWITVNDMVKILRKYECNS